MGQNTAIDVDKDFQMGLKTAIEYCDSTVNPTIGCTGCELWNPTTGGTCWAAGIHGRFSKGTPFEEIGLRPGAMKRAAKWSDLSGQARPEKPWLNGLPRIVFIGDMADNFCNPISFQYLLEEVIRNVTSIGGRRHFWLWFTKRPERMAEFPQWLAAYGYYKTGWPDNLMAVTSVTSQRMALSRISALGEVSCRWRGLSIEPLIGPLYLTDRALEKIDWVILGGQSGAAAEPMHLYWARVIRDQCRRLKIPFFFKQWGEWAPIAHFPGIDKPGPVKSLGAQPDGQVVQAGKRLAGRMLDGRTWNEIPLFTASKVSTEKE